MTNFYTYVPEFMERARHHSRGGRSRSARYMDRRAFVYNPELQSPNSDVRSQARAKLGPFNKPIYPARVTNADLLARKKAGRGCMVCGTNLADQRTDAIYCSDKCRKRDVRANGPRSPYMGEGKSISMKRDLELWWCPACGVHHHVEVLSVKPAVPKKRNPPGKMR